MNKIIEEVCQDLISSIREMTSDPDKDPTQLLINATRAATVLEVIIKENRPKVAPVTREAKTEQLYPKRSSFDNI